MKKSIAIILAAGMGSRMKSDMPKVLHPLGGKALLAHVIDTAIACCQKVIVVYGHDADRVRQAFVGYDCQWVLQKQQLGTGHAVQQAMPKIESDQQVLILSADVPLLTVDTLSTFISQSRNNDFSLMTSQRADPSGLGRIIRGAQGEIIEIVEEKDADYQQKLIKEINAGVYCANSNLLSMYLPKIENENNQNEFYLPDIVKLALSDNQIVSTFSVSEEETFGINTRVEWSQAERYFQRRLAYELLERGVWIKDCERIDIRGELHAEKDVEIDINTIIEGQVRLEQGVKIGANCIIRDSHIAAGSIIRENSVIENAIIGADCIVGPFARVRPGTKLEDNVRIGNFVETKQTVMHKGAKANHLAYIGNADIGEYTNVGAGTITCNYDGVNKHETIVGSCAFIGSNTALIAPVHVGDGATIGAGSVITRDVPADQLTLSRASQKTIRSWNRQQLSKDKES